MPLQLYDIPKFAEEKINFMHFLAKFSLKYYIFYQHWRLYKGMYMHLENITELDQLIH